MTTSCRMRRQALGQAVQGVGPPLRGNAAPGATESTPTLRLGRRVLACQTDRRIEENVMARKKDKKAQKDKKAKSAKSVPAAV